MTAAAAGSRRAAARALAAACLLLAGCAGGAPAPPEIPAPPPPAPPMPAADPAPPPAPEAAPALADGETAEEPDDLTVWLEGEEDPAGSSRGLAEAARAEKQRRAAAGEPVAVITDESLARYATGEITFAEPQAAAEGAAAEPGGKGEESEPAAAAEAEAHWRARLLEIRQRWRDAVDDIDRLEGEAAALRRRFYDEDDPYYRDSRIKPTWDLALERLESARRTAAGAEREVREAVEEGRLAGADPGWLREGIDLEPETSRPAGGLTDPEGLGILEPMDPEIVEDDDGGEP